MTAARDLAHVPDDWTLGIEVGGTDQKKPALAILRGDSVEQASVDAVREQIRQGSSVCQGTTADEQGQWLLYNQIVGIVARPDRRKVLVESGPEKSKRCDQSTGTDAGDNLKARASARPGPADEQSRGERPVVATA